MASVLFSTKAYPVWIGCAVLAAAVTGYGVWQAKVDADGPNRLIVPIQVGQKDVAQLFYDRGAGLREEDSDKESLVPSSALVEIAFSVPRVPLREVRFDPLMGAGKFVLGRPRLESASGRFVAKFPLTAIMPRHQIARLERLGGQVVGETEPQANDPMLTFELGGPLRVGSPRIPWPEGVLLIVFAYFAWLTRPQRPTRV